MPPARAAAPRRPSEPSPRRPHRALGRRTVATAVACLAVGRSHRGGADGRNASELQDEDLWRPQYRWLVSQCLTGMVRRCETATLLAVHAALGQRWICLPLAVLWVTGSVPVAYSFAGQFAAWALLVLVADCCAALHLAGCAPIHTSVSPRAGRAGAAAIACTATLIACCVPIVWRAVAVGTAAYIAAACALAARKRHPEYLFFAWALVESLLGAAVGWGLYFTRTLYADQMDKVTPGWRWLVLLYGANCALGIVSAVVEALAVLNMYGASTNARAAIRSKAGAPLGGMPLLPMGVALQPDHIEAASSVNDGERRGEMGEVQESTRMGSWRWRGCIKLGLVAWSGMLLFLTLGWLAMQLFPPGELWPDPPACSLDCFCKPLAGSLPSNGESPQQQHAGNHNGVQTLRNLPFGQAVLRRQNLRAADCNPNRSPCLNPFDRRLPVVEESTVTLHLDLYRPRAWAGLDQDVHHPAIVLAHPGGFSRGAKNSSIMAAEATFFAQHGFIAVAIDYRLEAASFLPEDGAVRDAIADTKAAVRWLRRNKELYGVDSDRIAVWGASAGGILAGTIGFARIREESSPSIEAYSSRVAAAVAVSGCLWSSILGEGDASRVTEKDVVPYLDIHGDADVQVGTWDSLFTYKYLESLGVPSENNRLVIVPGGGHVPWGDVEKERLRPVVMDFLIRQLHLENAECNGV